MQGKPLSKKVSTLIGMIGLWTIIFSVAEAGTFSSQYCQFELPPGWKCALEGTEWVCQSSRKDRKKEAIIILAAKIRGGQDDLAQYMQYLKKPKTFSLPGGSTQVSEAKYTKTKKINDHTWVDALHMASEVPGFYTRYMATVKEDLGVAVTFSVAKDHYQSYQGVFDKVVATLRVFRQKNIQGGGNFKLKGTEEDLLRDTTFIPDAGKRFDIGQRKKGKAGTGGGTSTYLILALVLGGGAFAAMKLRKKKGGGKKKKKKKKSE